MNPTDTNVLRPTTDGGPVTLANWYPDKEGPRTINVLAVDRAGRSSSIASCTFRVGKRPPTAQWSLGEVAGEDGAADGLGDNDATAGSGVTFGVEGPGGASDTAARFDGTANAHLSTARQVLTDTSASFAISGWFKVEDPARRQTARQPGRHRRARIRPGGRERSLALPNAGQRRHLAGALASGRGPGDHGLDVRDRHFRRRQEGDVSPGRDRDAEDRSASIADQVAWSASARPRPE